MKCLCLRFVCVWQARRIRCLCLLFSASYYYSSPLSLLSHFSASSTNFNRALTARIQNWSEPIEWKWNRVAKAHAQYYTIYRMANVIVDESSPPLWNPRKIHFYRAYFQLCFRFEFPNDSINKVWTMRVVEIRTLGQSFIYKTKKLPNVHISYSKLPSHITWVNMKTLY